MGDWRALHRVVGGWQVTPVVQLRSRNFSHALHITKHQALQTTNCHIQLTRQQNVSSFNQDNIECLFTALQSHPPDDTLALRICCASILVKIHRVLLATMMQPASLVTTGTEGWWASPEPIVVLPVIVASVCGHTSSGNTVSASASTVPAAHATHCSKCMPVTATSIPSDPVSSIPTVVGSVCHHALSGVSTPIGPTTVLAAATTLCASCVDFAQIAYTTASFYANWRAIESQSPSTYYAATQSFGRSTLRSLPP